MHSAGRRSAQIIAAVAIAATFAFVLFRRDAAPPPPSPTVAASPAATERAPARTPPRDEAPAPTPAPQAATTSTDTVRVFGCVTDAATGNPIAGARIQMFDIESLLLVREGAAIATSDANGNYEAWTERRASGALFAAEADNYSRKVNLRGERGLEPSGPEGVRVDLALDQGAGIISGTVVDEEARPVSGAFVGGALLHPAGKRPTADDAWCAVDTTDADGRFVLDALPPGFSFVFTANAAGYLPARSEETAVGSETTIVLARSEASVAGIVTTHDGIPLPGAAVVHRSSFEYRKTDESEILGLGVMCLTDASGAFAFPDLPAGPCTVSTDWAPRACGVGVPSCAQFELAVGEEREVVLRLPAPLVLTGRVFDVATGDGVAGAVLVDEGISNLLRGRVPDAAASTTRSAADGSYRLEVVSPRRGGFTVRFELPAGWVALNEAGGNLLHVWGSEDATSPKHDIAVTKSSTLRGLVVRADGTTPVPSAQLQAIARPREERGANFSARARTQADGTFEMSVPPGRTLDVTASVGGSSGRAEVSIPEAGAPERVVIALQEPASVSGRVTAGGKPVDGVHIVAMHSSAAPGRSFTARSEPTDSDGRYVLRDVEAGTVDISVDNEGTSQRNLRLPEPKSVELAPGGQATVDFELDWGTVIEGVVSNESGTPIEAASVNLSIIREDSAVLPPNLSARTDSEGYYAIGGLDANVRPQSVSASAKGYFIQSRPVTSLAESPINFTLRACRPVELFVFAGSQASPVSHYEYFHVGTMVQGGSWIHNRDTANEVRAPDGRTSLNDYRQGRHRLEVVELVAGPEGTNRGRKAVVEFSVHPDVLPDPVLVDIGAGVSVGGRVVTVQGTPVAGVRVALLPPGAIFSRSHPWPWQPTSHVAPTDETGSFAFSSVTPGSYSLGVWGDELLASREIRVPGDGSMESIEIVVALTGSIDVFVQDAEGYSRDSGIAYTITPLPDRGQSPTSPLLRGFLVFERESYARIEGVPRGEMTISVTMPDGRVGSASFEANPDDPDQNIVVDLRTDVAMTGTVRINGVPWSGKPSLALASTRLKHLGNGAYQAAAPPGSECLYLVDTSYLAVAQVEVPAGVAEFVHDFDLALASASVVLVAPEGHSVPSGSVSLSTVNASGPCESSTSQSARKDSAFFEWIPVGNSVASYISTDRLWSGKSAPAEIAAGADNVMTIDLGPSSHELVALGTWDTARMQPGTNSLTFDATTASKGSGHWVTLVLRHDAGDGSLEFTRAELSTPSGSRGASVAVLSAPGQVEAAKIDIHGPIPDSSRGATLTLDAIPRGNGTCTGTVYMKAY